jgi:LacI family transcriptional regulator, galactose operon repressor
MADSYGYARCNDPADFRSKTVVAHVRTTVKDIARHAGVSPATVSLVIRNSPLVAAETRERVRSSLDELGYVYDRAAANLRTRMTYTIGLIVCEITNPFYAELTAGIDDRLDRAGWVAFLANTAESPARQDRFIARMREHRVDGLLLAPAEGTDPQIIDEFKRYGLPVVQMLRRLGRRNADHVGADFRLGMTMAAEHLIRLGHKRIAFVGGARRISPARDRANAFRETLTRYGLPAGRIVNCLPTREDGAQAVSALFNSKPTDPTAIVCHNDLCALGVMLGLADRGLTAGQDVAVIGFDNIAEAALHRPALTTVAIGARQIGEEAASLLLRRIKNPDGAVESIVLPPKLIVRASCGGSSTQH